MAAVRLLPRDEVDGWKARLRDGVQAAQDRQRHAIGVLLTANGLRWSSPVTKAPTTLWDQDTWAAAVAAELAPAARAVAGEILGNLRDRTASKPWRGLSDPTERMVALVTVRAVDAGPAVGSRLSAATALLAAAGGVRYGGITHPEATPTILDEYQARFAELDRMAGNIANAMSNQAIQLLAETATATESSVSYIWNCSMSNSRAGHVDADGQPQPAGNAFDVDGEALLYPGDPDGSDENVMNCQCWLEVEGVDLSRDFEASLLDFEPGD